MHINQLIVRLHQTRASSNDTSHDFSMQSTISNESWLQLELHPDGMLPMIPVFHICMWMKRPLLTSSIFDLWVMVGVGGPSVSFHTSYHCCCGGREDFFGIQDYKQNNTQAQSTLKATNTFEKQDGGH